MIRKPYPSDVTDDEWAFVAPYLTLMKEDAPQREHDLREVFNGLRWIVRAGAQWRMMPHNLPPWYTVYQQAQRWIAAGVFEDMVHDLRALLRLAKGKKEQPSAVIFDGRTVQSTPESGERAGYDGHKRKKGSKIHIAVDTLGLLLAAHVTPANEQERAQVNELAQAVQEVTHNSVEAAFVDQGYTGDAPRDQAKEAGIELIVVKLPEAKKGFVLLPRRWVVERSFAWTARFRRLARDFERLPETFRRLKKVWADQGYKRWLVDWVQTTCAFVLEIVEKPAHQRGFVPQPQRWKGERSIAWFNRARRLSKDYERRTECSESMIYISSIRFMLRRLTKKRKMRRQKLKNKPYHGNRKEKFQFSREPFGMEWRKFGIIVTIFDPNFLEHCLSLCHSNFHRMRFPNAPISLILNMLY